MDYNKKFRGLGKDKDKVIKLIRLAEEAGWTAEITKANHIKLTSPNGQVVIAALTPRSQRAVYQLTSLLRQKGLKI